MPAVAFNTELNTRDANTNPNSVRMILNTEASKITRDLFNHMESFQDAANAQNDSLSAKNDKLREEGEDWVVRRQLTIDANRGSAVPKETLERFDGEIKLVKEQRRALESEPRIRRTNFGEIVSYVPKRRDWTNPDDLPVVDEFDAADEQMLSEVTETKTALRKELGKTEFARRDKTTILASMLSELDTLEKMGAPNLDDLAKPNDINDRSGFFEIHRGVNFIGWPMQFAQRGDDAQVFNALAFNIWQNRAETEKRLRAMIEQMPEGITAEEKVARVADLHEKIAATLRQEHAILVALEKRGNLFLRMENYHPAVALGLTAPARLIAQYTP